MTYVAVITSLGWLVTAWLLIGALRDKDREQARERRELYQRIQAPEVAIAQAATEGDPVFVNPVEAESDADWWRGRQERAALAGYDMPIDVPAPHVPDDDLSDLTGVS